MTDPQRWLQDPQVSDDVRELLQAGGAPPRMEPKAGRRLATYVTRLAAGTLATTALFSTKVVAALLALSVGAAVTWVTVERAQHRSQPTTPALDVAERRDGHASAPRSGAKGLERVAATPPVPAADTSPAVPSLPERPLEASDPPSRAALTTAPRRPKSAASAPASVAAPEDSLAAEAALLEDARARLARDPAAALSTAVLHASTYPAGQLSAERELIAIDALKRMGRLTAARQRAQALIARDQNGMYARRARRLLDEM